MAEVELLVRVSIHKTRSNGEDDLDRLQSAANAVVARALSPDREVFEALKSYGMEGALREVVVMPKRAIITISGGLVREVAGMPNRTTFEIHDYDVEVTESEFKQFPNDFGRDADGDIYFIQEV